MISRVQLPWASSISRGGWIMPFFTGIGQPVNAVDPGATSGANGRLRIDPDQLDAAIAVFQDAHDSVEGEVRRAVGDIRAMALAQDQVSNDAVNAFNRMSCDNIDSAIAAWEGAVRELRSIVQRLRETRQAIVEADASNVSNFQVQ